MIERVLIVVSALVVFAGGPAGSAYVASGFSRTMGPSYVVSGFPPSLRFGEARRSAERGGGSRTVAQTTDKNPLTSIKSLKCRFPVYAVGSWKSGEPKAEVKQAQQFSLDIDEIDADGGTARVTGTSGPTHVIALLTISSLHFMERTVTGTLTITTVFSSDSTARKFRAVHSRHDYLPMSLPGYVSEPSVSQNYGECEVPAAQPR